MRMDNFKIDSVRNGSGIYVTLAGKLSEDSDFSKIDLRDGTDLIVDWESVTGINSCGIREWLKFTSRIQGEMKVTFLNCSRLVVSQINLVNGFLPKDGKIQSFYVPYYC